MADESKNESQSAVDAALSGIPGLRESVQERKQPPSNQDYLNEGGGDPGFVANRPKVDDSDAVTEALSKIPGLREKMGG